MTDVTHRRDIEPTALRCCNGAGVTLTQASIALRATHRKRLTRDTQGRYLEEGRCGTLRGCTEAPPNQRVVDDGWGEIGSVPHNTRALDDRRMTSGSEERNVR